MAQTAIPNTVPNELKNPEHIVPDDVWAKIQADAATHAKEATEDGR